MSALPVLLFSGIWALLLGYLTLHLNADRIARVWPLALAGLGWTVWVAGNLLFLRWFWFSVYDLTRPPRTLVGQVVYLESNLNKGADDPDTFYVAIDDGSAEQVIRYEIDRALHDRLRYGSWLRLQVRPRLGSVVGAEVLAAPGSNPPEPAQP